MRPKVVFVTLLLAFAILGTAYFLLRPVRPEPAGGGQMDLLTAQISPNPLPASTPVKTVASPASPVVTNVMKPLVTASPVVQETNSAINAQDRVAELMALAMNNDANSLNTIWSELGNPDKEIRAGALAAVVQFGDHSVAPRLRELAAQTDDAAEKASIIEAANFLELPSITELHNAPATSGTPAR